MPNENFAAAWEAFRAQAVARSRLNRIAPPGNPSRLGYLALGLCGEAGEAVWAMTEGTPAERVSELGDVLWYLAMTEVESGVAAEWVSPPRSGFSGSTWRLMHAACAAAECIKRPVQGRELHKDALRLALTGVASALQSMARAARCTIEEAMAANVEKNHTRFGAEGFSIERQREMDAARARGEVSHVG
ncbi:MAG: hypothetical protein EPO40_06095 [Myxococcaceae bacterium]|nr:MAG: hypothetical protein EPO40_06095 [Myxococcaceae bacterium]